MPEPEFENGQRESTMASPEEMTRLLIAWREGDHDALDRLIPIVYDELRRMAQRYMAFERPGHTLQPTALVNEAYLRLFNQDIAWQNRAHFFGIAARLMRQILIDHARAHLTAKRGGEWQKVSLSDAEDKVEWRAAEILALDDALNTLASLDEQQSRIVELRFFGGLTIEETAQVLDVSHATVERGWSVARAWLRRQMSAP